MALPVSLRSAEPGDLDEVVATEAASFSAPWSRQAFEGVMDRGDAAVWVAEEPSIAGLAGYAVVWWVGDEGELANLAVAPERRGRGLGGAILDVVLARLAQVGVRRLYLEVRTSNEVGLRLYEGRGFERVGFRRDYYSAPREDAHVLLRLLDPDKAR